MRLHTLADLPAIRKVIVANHPTEVCRRSLPGTADRLARMLPLELGRVGLLRRRVEPASKPLLGWCVLNDEGIPTTRPFALREQADRFADLIGAVVRQGAPVLWLQGGARLTRMPLFGMAESSLWAGELTSPANP